MQGGGGQKRARPLNILTSPTSKQARRPQFAGWFKVQQTKQKSPLKFAACDSRCFLSSRALILTFVTWKSGGQDPKWWRALSRALPCVTCHPTASPLHSCVRAHTQVTIDHGPSFVFLFLTALPKIKTLWTVCFQTLGAPASRVSVKLTLERQNSLRRTSRQQKTSLTTTLKCKPSSAAGLVEFWAVLGWCAMSVSQLPLCSPRTDSGPRSN